MKLPIAAPNAMPRLSAGCGRNAGDRRPLFLAEKLLRTAAARASERDEIRLSLPSLVRRNSHLGAAAETDGILTDVERVEQKLLVAHGGNPSATFLFANSDKDEDRTGI